MKWTKAIGILVAIFITLNNVQSASANWYAGNGRTSAYGVKANIWAPSSAPYLKESGESNWVSLPSPYWVQAGWRYYKDGQPQKGMLNTVPVLASMVSTIMALMPGVA